MRQSICQSSRFFNVEGSTKLSKSPEGLLDFFPANRGFSLARPLAFTKSFAWLVVCRVVDLLTPQKKGEKVSPVAYKTNQLRD